MQQMRYTVRAGFLEVSQNARTNRAGGATRLCESRGGDFLAGEARAATKASIRITFESFDLPSAHRASFLETGGLITATINELVAAATIRSMTEPVEPSTRWPS